MIFLRLLNLTMTGLVTSACALAAPGVPGVSETEIRIGMVNAQNGPLSGLGQDVRVGAEAVFKEVNANGGIHGRSLVLRVADDGYDPPQTVVETLRLAQENPVFAFLGYVGTATANAVLPMIQDFAIPVVGVVSGALSLRDPLIREVFNVRASYENETEALIGKLMEGGVKTVGVVYQFDGFGLSVLAGTQKAMSTRGLSVLGTGTFQRNTKAIRMALGAMLEAQPDVVIFAGPYQPAAAFLKAARASGLKSRIAAVSFVGALNLLPLVGELGEGMLISQVVPHPEDKTVSLTRECDRLVRKHEITELTFLSLEGCLDAQVMVNALQRAGKGLTRPSFIAALEQMNQVDLGGMTIAFGPDKRQAMSRVYLTELHGGAIIYAR